MRSESRASSTISVCPHRPLDPLSRAARAAVESLESRLLMSGNGPGHHGGEPTVRFATLNASLNRNAPGQLITDLSTPDNVQAKTVAEIIQRTNPDVLLINEFDYYPGDQAADLFRVNYLQRSQNGAAPVHYPYVYVAPSNTGVASGFDLNNNGQTVTTPGAPGYGDDALGFGAFPGQFGMAIFSKHPILTDQVRTFQEFRWKDMPGALLPDDPATPAPADWYSPAELDALPLSSKSHWDVPVVVGGRVVHALAAHPTPPVFDGPEDRNGRRNHDEIRFWADYVTPGKGGYIYDDAGRTGGLARDARFVILGDYNADPRDGDSVAAAIDQLLLNPRVDDSVRPTSPGGPEQAALQGGANASHKSDPRFDTADFADNAPGNLRVDYVLPSRHGIDPRRAGVFWPRSTDPLFPLVGTFNPSLPGGFPSSDHRLVWADLELDGRKDAPKPVPTPDAPGDGVALPTVETPPVLDDVDPLPVAAKNGDADDPAIYVHPKRPDESFVIGTLKDGGLQVYDLAGRILQTIDSGADGAPRYNNVDLLYGFPLGKNKTVDLAVVSDRENDTLAAFAIDPHRRRLTEVPVTGAALDPIFAGDGEATAYGLATYTSPVSGRRYAFVTQAGGNLVRQFELTGTKQGGVAATLVRTITLPIPAGGELEDAQSEAMVVDQELGWLYIAEENHGILKVSAEPTGGTTPELLYSTDAPFLQADVEGLTIYYGGGNGGGYLIASSQGDDTYATFARHGNNEYLGSFTVGANTGLGIDSAEETDGIDVVNVPLGRAFPKGLLVVQDGNNDPAYLAEDDGELENAASNFKFVPWEGVAAAFDNPLAVDPGGYDPRDPQPRSLVNGVASGDVTGTSAVLWARSTFAGPVRFEVSASAKFKGGVKTLTATVGDLDRPVKVDVAGLAPGTTYHYRVTDAAGDRRTGRFGTAAAAGVRAGLSFGVSGDWRGELAPYPSVSNAAAAGLDLFVSLGDTIYADVRSPAVRDADGTRKPQATTLDEYRDKHAEVYGPRLGLNTLGDLRATTPLLATVDDHEVTNDFAGGAPTSSDPRFATDPAALINDTALYERGLQAFQEYNPTRDEFYAQTGDPRTAGERKLYRANTYGSDAAVIVPDARSFRDRELPGVTDPNDPAQVGAFLTASFDPTRTMLGRVQVDQLKADLLAAQAQGVTWKFVMVPEPIQNLGVLAASDRFEGYAAERTEILRFVDQNQIGNVVFVAADIHGTLVNNLTYQAGPGQAQIATDAFEITTGAVAYAQPFGQTVVGLAAALGIVSPAQKAFYDALPVAGDADAVPNDKDDFVRSLVNSAIAPLGYDPLGLADNLPAAAGRIDATLVQGDYVAAHTYGWTQFLIDPATQQLRVVTWGIPPYTEAELMADPTGTLARTPVVVSEFVVNPKGATPTAGRTAVASVNPFSTRPIGKAGRSADLFDDAGAGGLF